MKAGAIIRQPQASSSTRRLGATAPVVSRPMSRPEAPILPRTEGPLSPGSVAPVAAVMPVAPTPEQIEKKISDRLRLAMQAEANALKAAAQAEGMAAGKELGERQAREAIEARLQALSQDVGRIVSSVEQALAQRQTADEAAALELTVAVVTRLLGQMPDLDLIQGLLRQAGKGLRHGEKVVLRMSPADLKLLDLAGVSAQDALRGSATVVADPMVAGGCVLETERGELDARLQTQMQALVDMLTQTYQGHRP